MGTHRILIVEDEPDLLRGLALNIGAEGFDVLTAQTGDSGVKLPGGAESDGESQLLCGFRLGFVHRHESVELAGLRLGDCRRPHPRAFSRSMSTRLRIFPESDFGI